MKHLKSERLLELGLDAQLVPTPDEAAHLATCSACARELCLERDLTNAIEALPRPEPPPELVAATTLRFEAALARRRLRFTAVTLVSALALGLSAASAIVFGLVANAGAVVHGLVVSLDEVVVIGRATVTVLAALPAVPVALVIVACVVALALTAGVGRLALSAAEAK